jgi:hypothetical protein
VEAPVGDVELVRRHGPLLVPGGDDRA